jgi:hypothetical protein
MQAINLEGTPKATIKNLQVQEIIPLGVVVVRCHIWLRRELTVWSIPNCNNGS